MLAISIIAGAVAGVIVGQPSIGFLVGLAAGGSNPDVLAKQAHDFGVKAIAVPDATGADFGDARVFTGSRAVLDLIEAVPADVILNGITGSRGLEPTLYSLATGARLALANKESLS